jgi:hypothetical protein
MMFIAFAQLCAVLMLFRSTRWLLLPLSLLSVPIYDMTYPSPPNMVDACVKEVYIKGQERSKAIVAAKKCIERKESEWHAAQAQK